MATTTYSITDIESGEVIATKSKRATAVALADTMKGVVVATGKGTIVHTVPATRKIKMSAPYTRSIVVADDMIDGRRVAYVRARVGFALLDSAKGAYTVYDLANASDVPDVEVATTRAFGRWVSDEAPAYRASLVAADA